MKFPVIGNERTKNAVENMIAANRIPHAILIEGTEGDGKTALASFICTAAVCEDGNKPCGACDNCRLLANGNHPDVTVITTEKDRKTISVNQVREIIFSASVLPQKSNKKVFIINPADAMTAQAQNALLKVLEEPPASVIFILIATNRTAMLGTIISRCTLLSSGSSEEKLSSKTIDLANEFFEKIHSGSRYELMRLLLPLEKDRGKTLDFYNELEVKIISEIKNISSPTLIRRYDRMLDTVTSHKKLIKSNANLSLLLSHLAVKITER